MTQRQTQSPFSQTQAPFSQSQNSQSQSGGSLAEPAKPDATSPYEGPADHAAPERKPEATVGPGPEEMEQPYFSEAQSTLGAFAPAKRPGDPFAEPEDPQARELASRPAEQPGTDTSDGAEFATAAGTVRAGMAVVDSYGHPVGIVSAIEGERLRLASTDPHDDGVAFLPVGLIDGIDGDRVMLGGRGDASFGMAGE